MASTNINIRIDSNIKKAAEDLFSDLGLNMTSAITMFLKSAINCNGLPFEIKRPAMKEETIAALAEYEEMKKHPENYKHYSSFDDLLDEVTADA